MITRREAITGIGVLTLAAATSRRLGSPRQPHAPAKWRCQVGNVTYWALGDGRDAPILTVHGGPCQADLRNRSAYIQIADHLLHCRRRRRRVRSRNSGNASRVSYGWIAGQPRDFKAPMSQLRWADPLDGARSRPSSSWVSVSGSGQSSADRIHSRLIEPRNKDTDKEVDARGARAIAMQPIAEWLEKLGLFEYSQCFTESGIDLSVPRDLADQDLKEIGVLLGHRRKIVRAIAELAASAEASHSTEALDLKPRDAAERRQLRVVFCDLVGSTTLSGLDLEDLRKIIGAITTAVRSWLSATEGLSPSTRATFMIQLDGNIH
jgi:SAM domain (Sterile alpha motif)